VVGFDDLGGTDGFKTELLEERLAAADVLKPADVGPRPGGGAGGGGGNAQQQQRSVRAGIYQRGSDDEDSDFE
jgi:hypothetical protein